MPAAAPKEPGAALGWLLPTLKALWLLFTSRGFVAAVDLSGCELLSPASYHTLHNLCLLSSGC